MNLVSAWGRQITMQRWLFHDTISLGASARYIRLLNSIVSPSYPYPVPQDLTHVGPLYSHGLHFVFNTQENSCLGHDGYDDYQAPSYDGKSLFLRRMWVKGSLTFEKSLQIDDNTSPLISCSEQVTTPRQIASSVFVPINRTISHNSHTILRESRVLLYTNNQWLALKETPTILGLLAVSTEIKINRDHLLQYSMLTSNMHKIHFDLQYCRTEGLPDLIIHGPLMVSLLLHWFRRVSGKKVIAFDYKNTLPCFVNTPVKLSYEQELPRSIRIHASSSCLQKTHLTGIITTEDPA